jgi:hypothetical protein
MMVKNLGVKKRNSSSDPTKTKGHGQPKDRLKDMAQARAPG